MSSAKRQMNPRNFERKEALRKRWNFVNDVLTTQELLVAIQDAKVKAREVKDKEVSCMLCVVVNACSFMLDTTAKVLNKYEVVYSQLSACLLCCVNIVYS